MKTTKLFLLVTLIGLILGCSKQEDFSSFIEEQAEEQLQLGLSVRPTSLLNQDVTFTVVDDAGNDITESAIFYVNDQLAPSNSFSSTEEATFEVYAEYDNNGTLITTATQSFSFVIPTRKISIEDHTGTWCGYCPSVSEAIEEVYGETTDITVVAIHNNDAMALALEQDIREEFEIFGFPAGRINRTQNWSNPFEIQEVLDIVGTPSNVGIGITSSTEGNTLTAKVSVSSEESLSGKKLVVYLVEDGIVADQTNYLNNDEDSQYYQLGDPIVDFVHDHVLRDSFTNPFGDNIENVNALQEYTVTFTETLSDSYNLDNLQLVVMVTDPDYTTINSQYASINSSIWYND